MTRALILCIVYKKIVATLINILEIDSWIKTLNLKNAL